MPAKKQDRATTPQPGALRVLVVDDDKDVCNSICELVKEEGYGVTPAYGGRQALELIQKRPVHLVLTDLMMPEINGWQLLHAIKAYRGEILVVLFTGYVPEQAEDILTSREADGYLIKPIEQRRLQVMLRALLYSRNLGRAAEVVVVDDDKTTIQTVEAALSERGLYVISFSDSDEARQHILRTPPDLVITDIMMPGMTGFDLCHAIRVDPTTAYLPVIILTAHTEREIVLKAVSLCVNGFVAKPFTPEALAEKALQVLRQGVKPT